MFIFSKFRSQISTKINYDSGMKILWIFFGGHHKIGLYLGVITMHFRVSFSQGTEWGIFWGFAKISDIFLGCLKFMIFFLE